MKILRISSMELFQMFLNLRLVFGDQGFVGSVMVYCYQVVVKGGSRGCGVGLLVFFVFVVVVESIKLRERERERFCIKFLVFVDFCGLFSGEVCQVCVEVFVFWY